MSEFEKNISGVFEGNEGATRDLFQIVYDELRAVARSQMAKESSDNTLTPTGLVHEAFLKLGPDLQWNDSKHLVRAAARAMRHILIESARRKHTIKRGEAGGRSQLDPDEVGVEDNLIDRLAFYEAMEKLQGFNGEACAVVELKLFPRMTNEEIAESLQISPDKVRSLWEYARAKLSILMKN